VKTAESLTTIRFDGESVVYLDQRRLPLHEHLVHARTVDDFVEAIASLGVRGAPAIGIFGAYGVALLAQQASNEERLRQDAARIRAARPTAVNLGWAVDRVLAAPDKLAEARAIHHEQIEVDRRLAHTALELFPRDAAVFTHCNTGPIATGGGGTALGAIIHAAAAGRRLRVFVGETRPLLQGARLTMFELRRAGVEATLVVDSAAAAVMQQKKIDLIIVGADRIARNGDTANKIGTYGLAIAAAHHRIPFYVAAPRSSFDLALADGRAIPIEERSAEEVTASGANVYNPAFDITPGHLITAFVTEYGVLRPPYAESLPELVTCPSITVLMAAAGT